MYVIIICQLKIILVSKTFKGLVDAYISDKILQCSIGDGNSVMGACPSSQLVQDNQGLRCSFPDYLCCVCQFFHKSTLTFVYIVCSTHPTSKMETLDFPKFFS